MVKLVPLSSISQEYMPTDLPIDHSERGIFSFEIHFSSVSVVCVKLTNKMEQQACL